MNGDGFITEQWPQNPKKKPRRVKESQPAKHPVQDGGGGNEIIRDGVRAVIKS